MSLLHWVQAIFSLVFFKYQQVKNRLFTKKPLPLRKSLRFVQFGQESCPAGEYLHSERLWILEKVSAALKTTPTTIPTNST